MLRVYIYIYIYIYTLCINRNYNITYDVYNFILLLRLTHQHLVMDHLVYQLNQIKSSIVFYVLQRKGEPNFNILKYLQMLDHL